MTRTNSRTCFVMVLAAVFLMLALAAGSPALAKTYYVKPFDDGGLDFYNGETLETAWSSINNGDVTNVLLPGDVVEVQPGTYEIPALGGSGAIANRSGSPGSPIIYKAKTDGTVKIIASATALDGQFPAFNIAATVHDIVIQGFEIVGSAGSTIQEAAIKLNGSSGITIQNCYIHDLFNSKFTNYIDLTTTGGSDIWIHNNVISYTGAGSAVFGIVSYGGQTGLKVQNNVFDGVKAAMYFYAVTAGVAVNNNIVANCIYGVVDDCGGNVTNSDFNLFWNNAENFRAGYCAVAGPNDFTADPKFIGGAPFDYHLQPGSPAINAGTNVGLPYLQAAPDIGVYETNYATATVTGNVKTPGGAPLGYAKVEAVGAGLSTTADSAGHYQLGGLPAGSNTIKATFGRASTQDVLSFGPAEVKVHDFAITPAAAKTFYVKIGGDDTKDGESIANAWATINNGDTKGIVKPGDTVLVEPGAYAQNVTLPGGGAPGFPVTYRADGAAKIEPASGFVLDFSGTSHDLIIDGLELTGSGANRGIGFYGADRIVVQNCWIHDLTPGTVFYLDLTTGGSNGITIQRNVVGRSDTRSSYGFIDYGANLGLKVQHNIFHRLLQGMYVWAQTDPLALTNNIFTDCDYGMVNDGGGTVLLNSHNLFWLNGIDDRYDNILTGAGDRFVDPLFVGGAPFDYHLQAGSPAAEAGRDVGLPFTGLAPDIGLYETAAVHTPQTYHVKVGGNNAADGLTLGTAWATILNGDIKGKILPGDTVIVEAGDYTGALDPMTSTGAPGYPVTYKANGAAKIIAGAGNGINHGNVGHNLIIDGFEITGDDGSTTSQEGIKLNAVSDVTVKNCYIHNLSNSRYTDYVDMTSYVDGANISLHNNILRHTTASPLSNGISTYGGPTTGLKVLNNDVDGLHTGIYLYNVDAGVDIKNNILLNNLYAVTNDEGGTIINTSHNLFWNNGSNDRYGNVPDVASDITADPLFVGGVPYDYHLQAASPAVDSGIDVGLPYLQLAPDRGAIESTYTGNAPDYAKISDVKDLDIGSAVEITVAKSVTVSSTTFADGSYYIEEADRSSGIKVKPEVLGLPAAVPGQMITLVGVIRQDANGEKYIGLHSVSPSPGTALLPLRMNNRSMATASGPAVQGLLIRIWGTVTAVTPNYIYVNDGGDIDDGTGNGLGIRVMLSGLTSPITKTFTAGTTFVSGVTGAAGLDAGGVRCIRPRGNADIDL